jgi:GTP-binding protein
MELPTVVLIGRPNVGKSTIFNRLIEQKKAIISDIPGTTRDRVFGTVTWNNITFRLTDTAGLFFDPTEELSTTVTEQIYRALEQADLLLFVVDGTIPLTDADYKVANLLRKRSTEVIVLANKIEHNHQEFVMEDVYKLGFSEVFPISGVTGRRSGDVLDAIAERCATIEGKAIPEEKEVVQGPRVAIVGRPNVGKSTLINTLLGEDRVAVSRVAGTTRDAIDVTIMHDGQPFTFIDTAGIRRKGKQERGIEFYSVLRAMQAIERSDIILLLVDAFEGITNQDKLLLGEILLRFKTVLLLANKWDLVLDQAKERGIAKPIETFEVYLREECKFAPWLPFLTLAAKTNKRVAQLWDRIQSLEEGRQLSVPPSELKKRLLHWKTMAPLPHKRGKDLRIMGCTQTSNTPITFTFRVNDPECVHFSYRRFLENQLRKDFHIASLPINLVFKKITFSQKS